MQRFATFPILFLAAACSGSKPTPVTHAMPPSEVPASAATERPTSYTIADLALPGATAEGVLIDLLLYDPRTRTIWVPAGNTGSVDVIDTATRKLTRIDGFKTEEIERRG